LKSVAKQTAASGDGHGEDEPQALAEELARSEAPPVTGLEIVVVYDNALYRQDLEARWGFACVIRGPDETILFDTGGDGAVLLGNMAKLSVRPAEIDAVILSHVHLDHVGGLGRFLAESADVSVHVPRSFPDGLKETVRVAGARLAEVGGPAEICGNVYSTGEMGAGLMEQSLILRTDRGLIVITGCAHPGIVQVVGRAADLIREDVLLVMGGFHLAGISGRGMAGVLANLRELKVRYVGPCHCTGDGPIHGFEEEFGSGFVSIGVGRTIRMADLT